MGHTRKRPSTPVRSALLRLADIGTWRGRAADGGSSHLRTSLGRVISLVSGKITGNFQDLRPGRNFTAQIVPWIGHIWSDSLRKITRYFSGGSGYEKSRSGIRNARHRVILFRLHEHTNTEVLSDNDHS